MSSSAMFLSSFILCLWLQLGCCYPIKVMNRGASSVQDCQDLNQLETESGMYTVYPLDGKDPIVVYCDQKTDGGGWLVIQRRSDGSENFYRDWETYLVGFGNLSREFWLGNEKIHRLTKQRLYELRIDMENIDKNRTYALYKYFSIGPVTDYYRLFLLGYNGTSGDSFSTHNGFQFSAKNVDRDGIYKHCAQIYKGAWWYYTCHHSNLNGLYLNGTHESFADGVNWFTFSGYHNSLTMTEMKIRPMQQLLQE